jgi:hypothetical protein
LREGDLGVLGLWALSDFLPVTILIVNFFCVSYSGCTSN